MDLWIRSQDKKLLEKINSFEIVDESTIQANGFPYGTYKDKERALEVLDEIQEVLEQPQKHIEGDYTYYMPNDGSSKIYEMPQE